MNEIIAICISGVGTVVWYLLKQKDNQQQSELKDANDKIDTLFLKHDADVQALQELRVQIAAKHYERPELDKKFDKLETALTEGFKHIGERLDKMSEAFNARRQ